ncbi:hypothetical protein HDN1F_35540 [gamma proteobacterium HdN1]|nr:Hypothetical protein HDN1F_17650 [gamma proteobacterium HdN1]CBL47137.1 hypothetical protein HDN1F_35540 [gamma proteobacterium HdN1]
MNNNKKCSTQQNTQTTQGANQMSEIDDTEREEPKKSPEQKPSGVKACAVISQLNRTYLHAIIKAYEDHDLALLNALGISPPLADKLASAPFHIIERVGSFRAPIAGFVADSLVIERLLNHNLNHAENVKKADELLRYGANFDFTAKLTGLAYAEVTLRATVTGMAQPGSRPRTLTDEEWAAADAAWQATRKTPLIERWIDVAKLTGITIRRLHAAYRKYDYLIDIDVTE